MYCGNERHGVDWVHGSVRRRVVAGAQEGEVLLEARLAVGFDWLD